jgi:phage shock protein E
MTIVNRTPRTHWVLCAVALLPFMIACSAPESAREGKVHSVSVQELLTLTMNPDSALILDVRSESEFAAGHVPNAVNIPFDQLSARLGEIETDREHGVVVYCQSGRRASMAIETLHEAGVENVGHLVGDMEGWRAAQLPIDQ